jgi:hypothetical protein
MSKQPSSLAGPGAGAPVGPGDGGNNGGSASAKRAPRARGNGRATKSEVQASAAAPAGAEAEQQHDSADSASDADSAGSQLMAQRLAELESRELAVAALQQQLQQQLGLNIHAQQLQHEEFRVAAVQPPELTYVGATAGTTLEDWLFKLEQLFVQMRLPESAWDQRMRRAQLYWDRHMALWWAGQSETMAVAGKAVVTWSAFVTMLRRQFVPTGDAQSARSELFRLKMRSGENMDAYMQRAVLIVARAGAYVDAKTAGAVALMGADKGRYPFSVKEVQRQERQAGEAGMTFAQVRAALTAEAAEEPQLGRYSAAGGSGGAGVANGSAGGRPGGQASSNKQLRINALQQQLRALQQEAGSDTESDGGGSVITAAPVATSSSSLRCYKCGAEGHVVAECTSKKELRTCFVCKQTGHIAKKCSQRKRRAEGESAAGGGAKPGKLNTAAGASDKSASKND